MAFHLFKFYFWEIHMCDIFYSLISAFSVLKLSFHSRQCSRNYSRDSILPMGRLYHLFRLCNISVSTIRQKSAFRGCCVDVRWQTLWGMHLLSGLSEMQEWALYRWLSSFPDYFASICGQQFSLQCYDILDPFLRCSEIFRIYIIFYPFVQIQEVL